MPLPEPRPVALGQSATVVLEILDLRIERLNDFSEPDALAEGINECLIPATGDHPDMAGYMVGPDDDASELDKVPRESFHRL